MIKKIKWILCAVLCLGAMAVAGINLHMVHKTAGRILPEEQWKEFKADGILVLGCSVKETGEPSMMLEDRMKAAVAFYQDADVPVMLVSGDNRTEEYNEVGVMKEQAVSAGVPERVVYMDHTGLNTYDSMVHCKEFFGEGRVVIVTQSYHLYRALYLAEKLGIDAYGVAADLRPYALQFKRDIREVFARVKDFFYGICLPQVPSEAQSVITCYHKEQKSCAI